MRPIQARLRTLVRVTHTAFLDMLLATAEAALVPPFLTARSFEHLDTYFDEHRAWNGRGRRPMPPSLIFSETGLEVGGTLFGREKGAAPVREIVVERMIPTSAAIRCDDYIERSPISAQTITDLASAAGAPFGRALGDFHSHALLAAEIKDIERHQLFMPSPSDFGDDRGKLALVMTITFVEHDREGKRRAFQLPSSFIRQRVLDFEVWLTAYSAQGQSFDSFILVQEFQETFDKYAELGEFVSNSRSGSLKPS